MNAYVLKTKVLINDVGVEVEFGTKSWNISPSVSWEKGIGIGGAVNGHGFEGSYRPNAGGLFLIGVAVTARELLPEAEEALTTAQ